MTCLRLWRHRRRGGYDRFLWLTGRHFCGTRLITKTEWPWTGPVGPTPNSVYPKPVTGRERWRVGEALTFQSSEFLLLWGNQYGSSKRLPICASEERLVLLKESFFFVLFLGPVVRWTEVPNCLSLSQSFNFFTSNETQRTNSSSRYPPWVTEVLERKGSNLTRCPVVPLSNRLVPEGVLCISFKGILFLSIKR